MGAKDFFLKCHFPENLSELAYPADRTQIAIYAAYPYPLLVFLVRLYPSIIKSFHVVLPGLKAEDDTYLSVNEFVSNTFFNSMIPTVRK